MLLSAYAPRDSVSPICGIIMYSIELQIKKNKISFMLPRSGDSSGTLGELQGVRKELALVNTFNSQVFLNSGVWSEHEA